MSDQKSREKVFKSLVTTPEYGLTKIYTKNTFQGKEENIGEIFGFKKGNMIQWYRNLKASIGCKKMELFDNAALEKAFSSDENVEEYFKKIMEIEDKIKKVILPLQEEIFQRRKQKLQELQERRKKVGEDTEKKEKIEDIEVKGEKVGVFSRQNPIHSRLMARSHLLKQMMEDYVRHQSISRRKMTFLRGRQDLESKLNDSLRNKLRELVQDGNVFEGLNPDLLQKKLFNMNNYDHEYRIFYYYKTDILVKYLSEHPKYAKISEEELKRKRLEWNKMASENPEGFLNVLHTHFPFYTFQYDQKENLFQLRRNHDVNSLRDQLQRLTKTHEEFIETIKGLSKGYKNVFLSNYKAVTDAENYIIDLLVNKFDKEKEDAMRVAYKFDSEYNTGGEISDLYNKNLEYIEQIMKTKINMGMEDEEKEEKDDEDIFGEFGFDEEEIRDREDQDADQDVMDIVDDEDNLENESSY